MSATLSPVRLMSPSAMRFGVWRPLLGLIQGGASARGGEPSGWVAEWSLQRPKRVATGPLAGGYAALALVLLVLAWAARSQGWHQALPMAGVGLCLAGLALLLQVRRATDRDAIAMKPSLVRVEQYRAGHVHRVDFNPRWVRVEPALHDGSLVRLSGQGRSVVVGEFVPRASRPQLAEEFRWALRHLDD